jgi:NAD(P)-dependent dehydrogenase (short-subunit alcohol dehydrogenase family)
MSKTTKPVVLITGASGNVGQVLARELSSKARLAILDRQSCSLEGLANQGDHQSYGGVDLADEARVQSTVRDVVAQLGTVQALIHTVGGWAGGAQVRDQELDLVRRMLELNYVTAVTMVRAVLPHMLDAGHGTIVLFGSADALKGRAGSSAYAASKGALLRFSESLAEEVGDSGIRIRVILPTTIDTAVNRKSMPQARFSDWVTPQQIARTISFLIDEASDGIRYATVPMGR